MDTKMCSHMAAMNFLMFNTATWDTIAICNLDQKLDDGIARFSKNLLTLCFDSIEYPMMGFHLLDITDVIKAIDFIENKKKVMFTSTYGISRNAALAYVCNCVNMSPDKAIQILTPIRHYPNRRIIHLGAEVLNNPDIWEVYENWVKDFYLLKDEWNNCSVKDTYATKFIY